MKNEKIVTKNISGWKENDISIFISDDPKLTGNPEIKGISDLKLNLILRQAYELTKEKRPTDFNGDKLSVMKIKRADGKVRIITRLTDYFTLWGFPHVAPELFQKTNMDFVKTRESKIPSGLYAACLIVTADKKVLLNVISQSGGLNQGRLSFGFEEQSEPEDPNPVVTASRGFEEEYGAKVSNDRITVLGFGRAFNTAYVSAYCLIEVGLTVTEILKARENAEDKKESSCTLAVPLTEMDQLCLDETPYGPLKSYIVYGKLSESAIYVKHVANIPRWTLTKKHLGL